MSPTVSDSRAERLRTAIPAALARDDFDSLESPPPADDFDPSADEVFARAARLAKTIFRVASVGIIWLEEGRKKFRVCAGVDPGDEESILDLAAGSTDELTVIAGTHAGRFCAAAPVRSDRHVFPCALCLLDTRPREFGPEETAALSELAADLAENLAVDAELRHVAHRNSQFAAVIDHAVTAMVICDPHQPGMPIVFTNPAFSTITGYAREEALGRNCRFLQGPDTDASCVEAIRMALSLEMPFRGLLRNYRKDGTPFWNELTIKPVFDDRDTLVNYVGMLMDVTARIEVMETLQRSQENYRHLFDTNPLPCWAYDLSTFEFLEVNQAAVTHYGYSREEFLTMTLAELVAPEDAPDLRGVVDALHGRTEMETVWRHRKKDGTPIEIECASAGITFAGRAARLVIAHDVTERNRAVEHRRAKEEAERANEAKSDFLSRMSHELRTPLNAILGFSQLLELDVLTKSQSDSVQHIVGGGRHLLKLIDEVLDIARVESGRIELSLESLSIDELVNEALSLIAPLAAARGITLTTQTDAPSQPGGPYVKADRQRLRQVLLNLLSNAVKYNREKGSVTITRAEASTGRLRIRIADTGAGIPAHLRARLFMPFDRLGAEQTGVQGTGLGLSLSKHLMEVMDGCLGLEENPADGGGAAFFVELPLGEEPAATVGHGDASAVLDAIGLRSLTGPRTLLYVEDNLANITLVERLLAAYPNIHLISAMQGTLGLDLARQHRPDLILLDTHLPDLPGWELLERLRADDDTRAIPVVVVSADAMQRQADRLVRAGARAYLTKPLNVRKFLETVRDVLLERDTALQVG